MVFERRDRSAALHESFSVKAVFFSGWSSLCRSPQTLTALQGPSGLAVARVELIHQMLTAASGILVEVDPLVVFAGFQISFVRLLGSPNRLSVIIRLL